MQEPKKRQSKFLEFFKDYWNILLLLILILGIGIRIYYFNIEQAVWWDEAEYTSGAKLIGGKLPENVNYEFNPRRPFFLPLFWGIIFKLGGNEFILRFFQLLFSIVALFLTYLIGKEMYN